MPNSLWIGFGVNAINYSPGADAIIPGTSDLNLIPAHPHNWAVEVLSETGIIGFLPLLAAISWMVIGLLANFRRTGDLAVLAGIAVSLGYWGSGLFNFSFWSAWWQVSFFLMTSFCLAGCKK